MALSDYRLDILLPIPGQRYIEMFEPDMVGGKYAARKLKRYNQKIRRVSLGSVSYAAPGILSILIVQLVEQEASRPLLREATYSN